MPTFHRGEKVDNGTEDLKSELEEHDRVQVYLVWGISKRTRHGDNDRHEGLCEKEASLIYTVSSCTHTPLQKKEIIVKM